MATFRITRDDSAQYDLYKALEEVARQDVEGDLQSRDTALADISRIEGSAKPGLIDRLALAVEADSDAKSEAQPPSPR